MVLFTLIEFILKIAFYALFFIALALLMVYFM